MWQTRCHRCANVTEEMWHMFAHVTDDMSHSDTSDKMQHINKYKCITKTHPWNRWTALQCITSRGLHRGATKLLVESIESAGCGWLGRSIRRQRTLTLSKNPLQLKSLHIDSISECFFISNRSLSLETHLVCCGHYWCQMYVCCVLCVPFSGKRHRQPHLKRGPL